MSSLLARSSLGSLGIKIAIVGLAFLNQWVVTRLMGAEQYGLYVYALTWLSVAGTIGRLGLENVLTRYTAAYAAESRWGLLRGLARFGYGAVGAASLAVAGLALLVLTALAPRLSPGALACLQAALPLVPVYGLITVGQSLLYGLKRPWLGQLSEVFLRVFMIGLAGLGYLRWQGLSALQGLWCGLAAAGLVGVLSLVWVRRALPAEARSDAVEVLPRRWLAMGLPLLYVNGMKLLLDQGDILLIGLLIPDQAAVGVYAVAARLAELTTFGLQAVALSMAPLISGLHVSGRKAELQTLLTRAAYGIFISTLLIALALGGLGEFVLRIFGAGFGPAYRPMLILMGGQVINALTGTVGSLMIMTGHQGAVARIVTVNALLSLALNLGLIPALGLEGAALASASGTTLLNLAYLVYVLRRLGLNPTVFRSPRGLWALRRP